MRASERKSVELSPARWTVIVVGIGLVLGIVSFLLPRRTVHLEPFQTLTNLDIIASWVSMSLIVALLFIQAKTYSETRSPLALGLFIVLGAFLFQTLLTSPTFYAAFGVVFFGGRPSLILAADCFEAFAFTVLFYLSQ